MWFVVSNFKALESPKCHSKRLIIHQRCLNVLIDFDKKFLDISGDFTESNN